MRRTTVAAVVAALMLCLAGPAAAATVQETQLAPLGGATFPKRAFVLTVPEKAALTADDVSMRENGVPVGDLRVTPGSVLGQRDFGAVLVIDASSSMHGRAIEGAMRAARSFARRRDPLQPIGVVTFNDTTKVVLPPTTDGEAIKKALATAPELSRETHVYDATAEAMSLLNQANIKAGTVIVLSDGADTGSTATLKSVSDAARKSSVRVFSVGLRTRAYSAATLTALAEATKGSFDEAGSARQLDAIYKTLGSTLSNQYVLTYRSTSKVGQEVRVAVRARGQSGIALTSYTVPPLSVAGEKEPGDGFFGTTTSALLLSLLCAVLLGGSVLILTAPRRSVRSRVAQYVDAPTDDERVWSRALVSTVFGEQSRARRTNRQRLAQVAEELELASIQMTPEALFFWITAGSILVGAFFAVLFGSGSGAVLGMAVPVGAAIAIRSRVGRQRREFADQLPENLQVLASAMRAGHTFSGALATVVDETPEPSRRELRRVLTDEQIGVPLHEALLASALRMQSPDLERLALVTSLQQTTGGNTAEVMDSLHEGIRERLDVERLVRTLTAQGRITQLVVTALPPGILLILTALDPDYVKKLYTEPIGIAALIIAAAGVAAGSLMIKRIVDIKV